MYDNDSNGGTVLLCNYCNAFNKSLTTTEFWLIYRDGIMSYKRRINIVQFFIYIYIYIYIYIQYVSQSLKQSSGLPDLLSWLYSLSLFSLLLGKIVKILIYLSRYKEIMPWTMERIFLYVKALGNLSIAHICTKSGWLTLEFCAILWCLRWTGTCCLMIIKSAMKFKLHCPRSLVHSSPE